MLPQSEIYCLYHYHCSETKTCPVPKEFPPSHTREQFKDQNQVPVLCPTALRVAKSYTRDYILIANFVAMLLLPFLIITILNFRLFKTIKV